MVVGEFLIIGRGGRLAFGRQIGFLFTLEDGVVARGVPVGQLTVGDGAGGVPRADRGRAIVLDAAAALVVASFVVARFVIWLLVS